MALRVGIFVCLMGVVIACAGKKRDFAETTAVLPSEGDEASDASAQAAVGAPRANGAACGSATECASGSCVDGFCCNGPCDSVCTACNTPGREGQCSVTPNDTACAAACPDSTECRTYGSSAGTANCEAAGVCREVTECVPIDSASGTPCRAGAGTCDGLGECIVPGAVRLGQPCTNDGECGEGHCVVGSGGSTICCDSACAGLCRTCDATGRCDDAPRDDARCSPVDCPSDDVCRDFPDDVTVNLCRGYGTCRNEADCTPNERRLGAECVCGATGCALTVGVSCSSPSECDSGWCEPTLAEALVCCAEDCAASGAVCSSDGTVCVQCEGDRATCDGGRSNTCEAGLLTVRECPNACNSETGACNDLRPTGTGCEVSQQCTSGLCALDTTGTNRCCDASCEQSGRACGPDGTCVCSPDRVDVGGNCLLNDGEACANPGDCASGSCVATVAGANICCATACPGAFCGGDGSSCVECEGNGTRCAGNQSERCDNGDLAQTPCGNGCNPNTGLCTGLLANGQTCGNNAQCNSTSCAADIAGTMRCCTPNCAASGRVCGADGSCVCASPNDVFIRGQCRRIEGQSCNADGNCRSDACEPTQSGGQVCCTGACNGQICRASGQGCVQCEGGPPTCQGNNSRSCVNNTFVTTSCGNGCNANTGLCNNLIPLGGTGCTQNVQCAGSGSSCENGRCCEFDCSAAGRTCSQNGLCQCPPGTTPVGNACLLTNGQDCDPNRTGQCASGSCLSWYRDVDGDGHGNASQVRNTCGTVGSLPPDGFVVSSDDCCDRADSEAVRVVAARVFRGQTQFFSAAQDVCSAQPPFDYNCDGLETKQPRQVADCSEAVCRTGLSAESATRPCGANASFLACGRPTLPDGRLLPCQGLTGGMDNPISCQ
jgi:hypothetical protein